MPMQIPPVAPHRQGEVLDLQAAPSFPLAVDTHGRRFHLECRRTTTSIPFPLPHSKMLPRLGPDKSCFFLCRCALFHVVETPAG